MVAPFFPRVVCYSCFSKITGSPSPAANAIGAAMLAVAPPTADRNPLRKKTTAGLIEAILIYIGYQILRNEVFWCLNKTSPIERLFNRRDIIKREFLELNVCLQQS